MNKFGYGSKISTEYKAKVENKWRRVYCTCFSNNASYWVIVNKQKKKKVLVALTMSSPLI